MSLTLAFFFLGTQGALPEGPLVFGGFSGEFFANGSYRIEAEGWTPLEGSFHVVGSELVLASPEGASECTGPGRYSFGVERGRLTLRLAADDCTARRMILDGSVWRSAAEKETLPERRIARSAAEARRSIPDAESASGSWPSFRGPGASGVASGQNLPDEWDGETGKHVLWKTPIEGLAHSSPIVWGARIFVTSAVSSREGASFRPGLYGDGDASDDRSRHQWILSAFDKRTGVLLWKQVAYEGVPIDKRHIKSTYASATPATDGRIVVASFGSQGLHAYDVDGEFLWKVDVGRLNLGAYDIPTFEWGPASSPILWRGMVFLQCDTQDDSFVLALDAETGKTLWKTERDELPSWATPFVYEGASGFELVTNAPNFIRGYDPRTGGALASGRQLQDHGAHSSRRGGIHRRRERTPARAADIRRSRRVPREPHARSGAGVERRRRLEPHPARSLHADASCTRGHSLRSRKQRRLRRVPARKRKRNLPAADTASRERFQRVPCGR